MALIVADSGEKVKSLCFVPMVDRGGRVCYTYSTLQKVHGAEETLAQTRSYELLYIVRPDLAKDSLEETINKFQRAVNESGGQVVKVDEWGLRTLAYQIKHLDKGYYVFMEFSGTPDHVRKLEERLKLDENILRYQIVRQE